MNFPILRKTINGHKLVYLDNAATTQKPKEVIDAIVEYYTLYNANIHRGLHTLSTESSNLWDKSHEIVADFINAKKAEEIIFVRNTTEALNLIAQTYGVQKCQKGDVIAISEMEHHSNMLPWQFLAKQNGLKLEWIPVNSDTTLDMNYVEYLVRKYREKLKIVSLTHISNVTGVKNDIKKIASTVHKYGAILVVDGAQAIAHTLIDVQKLDCDYYVFSGHKIYAPTGAGVVYGKYEIIKDLDPFMRGGGMITDVERSGATWQDSPTRFEAGTPDIAGGIGLAVALLWFHAELSGRALKTVVNSDITMTNSACYGNGNSASASFNTEQNNYSNVSQASYGNTAVSNTVDQGYGTKTYNDYGSGNGSGGSSSIDDVINNGGRYRYAATRGTPVGNAYSASNSNSYSSPYSGDSSSSNSYSQGAGYSNSDSYSAQNLYSASPTSNNYGQTSSLTTSALGNELLMNIMKYGSRGNKILRRELAEGYKKLEAQEAELMKYAINRLSMMPEVQLFGPDDYRDRTAVLSFIIEGIHPHDVASELDEKGIAIRAGMHCAHPLHRRFGLNATARASFGIYNSLADVEALILALADVIREYKG